MSTSHTQSRSGGSSQPQDICHVTEDHQTRIRNFEATLERLPTSFQPCSEEERARRQQLYGDAYHRIIEYYRHGGRLPTGENIVFTVTGIEKVWWGTVKEMMKRARELKGFPVSDHYAVQAGHNTGSSKEHSKKGKGVQAESTIAQMAQNASFRSGPSGNLHPMGAQFRLPSDMGGNDETPPWRVDIAEDSGSNIQTVTTEMWHYVNVHGNVAPWTNVVLADGSIVVAESPSVEMQLMNKVCAESNNWEPLTGWFVEPCVVRDNCSLLSGREIRKQVYIGSSPTSSRVFVAKTKNGLMNVLPAH